MRLPWFHKVDPVPPSHVSDSTFFVPPANLALVIRDGVPEQFHPPGLHALAPAKGKVEVRLLPPDSAPPGQSPPDGRALTLPYERSLLYVEGALVAIVKPAPAVAPALKAWEGFKPAERMQLLNLKALQVCLSEPQRVCQPSSGLCCGGRLPSFAGSTP